MERWQTWQRFEPSFSKMRVETGISSLRDLSARNFQRMKCQEAEKEAGVISSQSFDESHAVDLSPST